MSNQKYYPTQQFGGDGGKSFDDVAATSGKVIVGIKSITLRSGSAVDAIQAVYLLSDGTTYTAGKHGGNGGDLHTINFEEGEKIIAISGRSGSRVDQLIFLTELLQNAES